MNNAPNQSSRPAPNSLQLEANQSPRSHDTAIILTPRVTKVLWAAMAAMVKDVHAPQDNLTAEEWQVAGRLLATLNEEMNDNAS